MAEHILITGYLRSGTTLLEKLLHNHPDACIGSQPFPYLFYKAKEAFYADKGLECDGYPLGHLFLESSYSQDEFNSFIKARIFTANEVAWALKDMEGYSGCLTPEIQDYRGSLSDGTFIDIYRQLAGLITKIFRKEGADYAGSKEVFCEEFVPLFLDSGAKVIIVIRDPRDVLTSMNFGKGEEFVSKGLPTLYALRSWRKSVAFALAFKDNPDFFFVRYEDLVQDSWATLRRLTDFLSLEPFPDGQFREHILDQHGKVWMSNSSFEQTGIISGGSLGKFRQKMTEETLRYVETVCYPEMRALGYELEACQGGPDEKAIRSFREPMVIEPKRIPADYSTQPEIMEQEIRRLRLLEGRPGRDEKQSWFIFPSVYDELKRTCGALHA